MVGGVFDTDFGKPADQYALESLLDYFRRSRQHLNNVRGFNFSKKYGAYPR